MASAIDALRDQHRLLREINNALAAHTVAVTERLGKQLEMCRAIAQTLDQILATEQELLLELRRLHDLGDLNWPAPR
jgi:hypothetical protein